MEKFKKLPAAVGAVILSAAGSAFADLPTGVASGITDAQEAGIAVIGLLSAAGAAVWLLSKVLRKFGIMM